MAIQFLSYQQWDNDPAQDVSLEGAIRLSQSRRDAEARADHLLQRATEMRTRRANSLKNQREQAILEAAKRELDNRTISETRIARINANMAIRQRKREMNLKIFLSYPEPKEHKQRDFVQAIEDFLDAQGLVAQRLGSKNFSHTAPLKAVRELMEQCKGLLCIAFRRTEIIQATMTVRQEDGSYVEELVENVWQTSPWCHIETAMAYQMRLPLIVMRQTKVIDEGVLHWGNVTRYMPAFDLDGRGRGDYLKTDEWKSLSKAWNNKIWKDANWTENEHMYYDEDQEMFVT